MASKNIEDIRNEKIKALARAKEIKAKLLEERKKREKELYKKRIKYLDRATKIREKKRREEEKEKIKKHNKYMMHKIRESFRLWWKRTKEDIKKFGKGKTPDIKPIEDAVIKEISKPNLVIKVRRETKKVKGKIGSLSEGIAELKKPEEKIKQDVKRNKKGIKSLLSAKIYYKTKELIMLEKRVKELDEKLRRLKNPREIRYDKIKKINENTRKKIEKLTKAPKKVTGRYVKLGNEEKEITKKIEDMRK